MTEADTIARLQRLVEGHSERLNMIEVSRAAEAERWKMASRDIAEIKDEVKAQNQAQQKRFNFVISTVGVLLIGGIFNWIIKGGLSGG